MSKEKEFTDELNIFKNEVMSVLKSLYVELAIHEFAAKDKKFLDALNYSPTFWNTVLSALQHSTFTTLGRIFDNNGRNSINTLLRVTKSNKDLFTKESFSTRWESNEERRKIDTWLPEYLKKVYVPKDKDFKQLEVYVSKQKAIYKKIYRPIRDHFGHRLYNKNVDIKVIFDKVNIRDLEKFCVRLEGLYEVLWQLYHNGVGPLLPLKKTSSSTRNILRKNYKEYDSMPTNAQFVVEVGKTMKLLKLGKQAVKKASIKG